MLTKNRLSRGPGLPALLLTGLLVLLATHGTAFAGAWTAKEGAAYTKLSVNYFWSDESFVEDSDYVKLDSTFTDLNLSFYMEYGLRDDLTLFLSVPYKWIESDPDSPTGVAAETWGIGDIDVGARYKLHDSDKGVFSIQGLVKIPEAYDEDEVLVLGNSQYDYEIRLLYGRSLYPKPFYYGLELGYRWRSESPSDEVKYLIEVGYTHSDKVSFRVKLDGTYSMDNADSGTATAGNNPTLAQAYDLGKLELTAGYQFRKDLGLEFTWTPTLYGQFTSRGHTLSLALVYAIN